MSTDASDVDDTALNNDEPRILCLPTELLEAILLAVLTDAFWAHLDPRDPAEVNAATTRTELQLVCKHWQSAILHCPRFWVYLDLRVTTTTAVQRAVRLSAATPLWIAAKGGKNAIYSSWQEAESQQAKIVAGLLSTEGHRIGVLILDVSVSDALSKQNLSEPINLPEEAAALQYLELHVSPHTEKAPDPLWLAILSRAPHLTWFYLFGVHNQTFWTTLANSAPITRLKYLELDGGDRFPLLDFVSLVRRLPQLEGLTVWHVIFTEHAGHAAAALENAKNIRASKNATVKRPIELPRLRYLHIRQGDSKIFGLIQKLVLPPGVNFQLDGVSMIPGDSDRTLRAMSRIAASILPDAVRDLHLNVSDTGFCLYGFKSRDFHPADYLEPDLLVQLVWYGTGSDMPLDFVRRVYELLPLNSVHFLQIKLDPDPCSVHREIEVLRPMLARLTHVEELYITDEITEASMASVAKLLRIDDGEPVPLPRLVSLSCDKIRMWCPACASEFLGDLCKVLRARIAGGRPIARVLARVLA
ncbi:hypothetical protein PsYK624_160210 [Phanerochaete sordida]|uniref:F-box domain-containing protein n=1 Tax=Phanerochaete sordida TaxID=48140 RepID=A0A9P3GUA5_9APHY|nr:hypothetical protein PsYK624_160210 [Phanerochaete sordida]